MPWSTNLQQKKHAGQRHVEMYRLAINILNRPSPLGSKLSVDREGKSSVLINRADNEWDGSQANEGRQQPPCGRRQSWKNLHCASGHMHMVQQQVAARECKISQGLQSQATYHCRNIGPKRSRSVSGLQYLCQGRCSCHDAVDGDARDDHCEVP